MSATTLDAVSSASTETFSLDWKIATLKIASYLNESICKVREYYYTFYTLNETCRTTAEKVMRVALLCLRIFAYALLVPFTAPLAAALRGAVAALESKPYLFLKKAAQGKVLPEDKKITLLSHNQCYVPAGYSITDGQITPPSDKGRIKANVEESRKLNPDVLCLYEVADICDAEEISSQLPEYPFLIPVAGVRALGPSSMMYIASKYEIVEDSITFAPFVKGTELTGEAQFSEKGYLSFDLKSRGEKEPFATVVSTHLQHSKVPASPKKEDVRARALQMEKIARHIQEKIAQGRSVIFTGDLNQGEEELNHFFKQHKVDWLRRDESVRGHPTWGGDEWCAKLMGRAISKPMVLDYTFVAGKAASIRTQIFKTGFYAPEFRPEARSDHSGLFSTIKVGSPNPTPNRTLHF